jgi:hypothetical protein
VRFRFPAAATTLLLGLALAAPAGALSLADDAIVIEIGDTVLGTIALQGVSTGIPIGAAALEGVPGAADTSFAFRITLAPTARELGGLRVAATSPAGPTPRNPTGGGVLPGSGVAIGGVGRISAGPAGMLVFVFAPGPGPFEGLGPGQTSAPFFVSFADLEAGDLLQFGIPSLLRVDFLSTEVVPEPASAALLFGGLAGLVAVLRRGAVRRAPRGPGVASACPEPFSRRDRDAG